jgi:hypothetical protein
VDDRPPTGPAVNRWTGARIVSGASECEPGRFFRPSDTGPFETAVPSPDDLDETRHGEGVCTPRLPTAWWVPYRRMSSAGVAPFGPRTVQASRVVEPRLIETQYILRMRSCQAVQGSTPRCARALRTGAGRCRGPFASMVTREGSAFVNAAPVGYARSRETRVESTKRLTSYLEVSSCGRDSDTPVRSAR